MVLKELPHVPEAKPLSPNEKPNIALIGCGGQGRYDTTLAAKFANVIAVCDVDAGHAEAASRQFGGAPGALRDFRKVLERDDIHVIINGTPDHWHTLVNIAGDAGGKDVYSEKPLTLTIDEGKRLVAVVKETAASCRPAASSGATRPFAWRANWFATAASAR